MVGPIYVNLEGHMSTPASVEAPEDRVRRLWNSLADDPENDELFAEYRKALGSYEHEQDWEVSE